MHREYPRTVNARMESTIRPFIEKSLGVNYTLLAVLGERLGLPAGALERQHTREEPSGSEARCIKNPPRPEGMSEERAALGAHTDFGSLVSRKCVIVGMPVLRARTVILAQPTRRAAGYGARHERVAVRQGELCDSTRLSEW